jgi:hypothetical protein
MIDINSKGNMRYYEGHRTGKAELAEYNMENRGRGRICSEEEYTHT